jgi:hypothetical protein
MMGLSGPKLLFGSQNVVLPASSCATRGLLTLLHLGEN